ncbi:MAG: tetratricopeptide repeat protein [Candidatus Omnitrophica bacterium]|nr:tetratricopeptide repeat protein [Candidatus Omnitrophota bacterium]
MGFRISKGRFGSAIKCLLCAAAVLSFCICSHAEEREAGPERLFARGNDYYEQGDYQNAINEYKKIIDGGQASGPLYYNIAGAYFKSGQLGKAVLNYRRAMFLMPRDGDLKANYKFAKSAVLEKPPSPQGIWQKAGIGLYAGNFTVNELAILSSAAYILALFLLYLLLTRHAVNWYLSVVILCLVLYIGLNMAVIWKKAHDYRTGAVTVSSEAQAYYGPFDTATKFFTLNEGVHVNVLSSKDDWYKVRRRDGKIGWVKKTTMERI